MIKKLVAFKLNVTLITLIVPINAALNSRESRSMPKSEFCEVRISYEVLLVEYKIIIIFGIYVFI